MMQCLLTFVNVNITIVGSSLLAYIVSFSLFDITIYDAVSGQVAVDMVPANMEVQYVQFVSMYNMHALCWILPGCVL